MGKKEKAPLKVVLDTNILVSALLFRGELSRLVDLWKNGKLTPVISKETFRELKAVFEYPKFHLTKDEIKTIIEEEILPFFEVVEVAEEVSGICNDPDDDKLKTPSGKTAGNLNARNFYFRIRSLDPAVPIHRDRNTLTIHLSPAPFQQQRTSL